MSFPSRMLAREFEVFCAVAYRISSITIAPIRHVCTLCVIYFLRDDDAGLQHCTYVHTILVDCERLAVIVKRGKSRLKTADYTNRLFYDLTWDIFCYFSFFLSSSALFPFIFSTPSDFISPSCFPCDLIQVQATTHEMWPSSFEAQDSHLSTGLMLNLLFITK